MIKDSDVSGLTILRERQRSDYTPGSYEDGNKVLLSIDSGGMAGVVSLGECRVMQDAGMLEVIDGFSGASAGALNSTYAATGQVSEAIDVYTTYLPEADFININPKRWLEGYLANALGGSDDPQKLHILGNIMREGSAKLDTQKLKELAVPVVACVTDLSFVKPVPVSVDLRHIKQGQIVDVLLRGAAIPFVCGSYKYLEGIAELSADGGLALLATEQLALEENPTHIISLANRPHQPHNYNLRARLSRRLLAHFFKSELFGWGVKDYMQLGAEQADFLRAFTGSSFDIGTTRIDKVHPDSSDYLPGMLCMNKQKLHAGADAGALAMQRALDLLAA